MDKVILPACYLPPAAYFSVLLQNQANGVLTEQFEHYPKQTYRSRASILGANGRLDLYIPVQKGTQTHTVMKDVQISYGEDWQRLHWMSIQTAYRSSAYFEYYEDEFAPFYQQPYKYLLDYNLELTGLILRMLKIDVQLEKTGSYRKDYPDEMDFRERIHPKKVPVLETPAYPQVFADRFDFIPNLSIVDLLFNQGPGSISYLRI